MNKIIKIENFITNNLNYSKRDKNKWGYLAIKTFPFLLWCAQHNKKITYTQLAHELYERNIAKALYVGSNAGKHIGKIAGIIGDYLYKINKPPLNTIVVGKNNGIPSNGADSFINNYLKESAYKDYNNLKPKEKRLFLEEHVWPDIYEKNMWDIIIKANDIKPIKPNAFKPEQTNESLKTQENKYRDDTSGEKTEESPQHKKLKEFIRNNPSKVKLIKDYKFSTNSGTKEYQFASLDKVDVLFEKNKLKVGLEVKSIISNDDDIIRGIYQCVKYRALINAELKRDAILPNGQCFLIVERGINSDLKELAYRLNVKYEIIKVN